MVELPGASVGDPVQLFDGVAHLGEIRGEVLVHFQLGLDGIEHFQRRGLGRADQRHELAVTVNHRPDGGGLGERALTRTARHRQREQSARQHSRLDFLNDLQVVRRPFQRIGLRKVALAEQLEVAFALLLPFRIHHLRQIADVTPRERLLRLPRPFRIPAVFV